MTSREADAVKGRVALAKGTATRKAIRLAGALDGRYRGHIVGATWTILSIRASLDRATGELVWPIEERRVPQSDVPGEHLSPCAWPNISQKKTGSLYAPNTSSMAARISYRVQ